MNQLRRSFKKAWNHFLHWNDVTWVAIIFLLIGGIVCSILMAASVVCFVAMVCFHGSVVRYYSGEVINGEFWWYAHCAFFAGLWLIIENWIAMMKLTRHWMDYMSGKLPVMTK